MGLLKNIAANIAADVIISSEPGQTVIRSLEKVTDGISKKLEDRQEKKIDGMHQYADALPANSYYCICLKESKYNHSTFAEKNWTDYLYDVYLNKDIPQFSVKMSQGICRICAINSSKPVAEIRSVANFSLHNSSYQIKMNNQKLGKVILCRPKHKLIPKSIKEEIKKTFNPEYSYQYQFNDWIILKDLYGKEAYVNSESSGKIATIKYFGESLLVHTPGDTISLPILISAFLTIMEKSAVEYIGGGSGE